MPALDRLLDDLESRIDPGHESALTAQWLDFLTHGLPDPEALFAPRRTPAPSRIAWPEIRINQTLGDTEKAFDAMLLQQFAGCSQVLASSSGQIPCVRSNYGSCILASILGEPVHIMDDVYNTLPTSQPLAGGIEGVRALVDRGVPDVTDGQGARVFEAGRRLRAALDSRPNLSRFVHLYHPDLQGPLDIAELLWGNDLFTAFYDEPGLVHRSLQLITETYQRVLDAWHALTPPPRPDRACHWGMLHRGLIFLRLDSGMNISPAIYREFSLPYDAALLARYGGCVHSCGRVEHIYPILAALPNLHGLNLSQPGYNDMERIYRATIDAGIRLLSLPGEACDRMTAARRPTRGLVHRTG